MYQPGMVAISFGLLLGAKYISQALYRRWRGRLQESLGRSGQVIVGCVGIPGTVALYAVGVLVLKAVPPALLAYRFIWYHLGGELICAFILLTCWMFFAQMAWYAFA